jgi:subtilisin family serine protease
MTEATYTYQGGRRLPLARATTHFISRAGKGDLLCDRFELVDSVSHDAWAVRTNSDHLEEDLRRARRLAPAYPAYVSTETGTDFFVTDRIFIRFRRSADVDDGGIEAFVERHELAVVQKLGTRDYVCRVNVRNDVVDVVRRLTEEESDIVEIVDHDLEVQPQENQLVITDPLVPLQWYLLSAPADEMISSRALLHCHDAWELGGFGSKDVVIGVVDCGCDLTDPNFAVDKFAACAALIDGVIYSEYDSARAQQIMEPARLHGTLCATLAAASANQTGGLGVAPECRLVPVKWQELDSGPTFSQSSFTNIIRFLRDKADIVTCSWSLGANGYWPAAVVDCLVDAALHGGPRGKGMVWVWSVGNHNSPIDYCGDIEVPTRVGSRGSARIVEATARRFTNSFTNLPGVLQVGAISSRGQRCHYSNYGKGLDLVAPSSNYHIYGRLSVSGVDLGAPLRERELYAFGGTSASAPLVAGVAALIRSANPDLTSREVCSILKQTSDRDLDMSGYSKCGRPGDSPNADWDVSPVAPFHHGKFRNIGHPDGTWSAWFGFGKVNARRAVEKARACRKAPLTPKPVRRRSVRAPLP